MFKARQVAGLALVGLGLTTTQANAADVPVSDAAGLVAAIGAAQPGDTIILASGVYSLTGVSCTAAGTTDLPIVVKSAEPLGAKIEFDALEGFHVLGPNWHFEDLDIRGACADDSNCEHAFHVVGHATGFVMRKNKVADFNAHLKVNNLPENGTHFEPDGGLVEGNELFDSHPRNTGNPVTPLNIDNASNWIVRANVIYDFHKAGGNEISYGAFNKGGGKNPLFERNLVICSRFDMTGGVRIGLSFGGGGQDPSTCAPAYDANVPCDPENDLGIMRNNIVVNCSDVGIYLNKASNSKILHNTLIATNGVDFRFASSTGEAHGNVLASKIRTRDGGTFLGADNLMDVPDSDFLAWYVDPMNGDLRMAGDLSSIIDKGAVLTSVTNDYCARDRTDGAPDWGALEHSLGDCDTTVPPLDNGNAGSSGTGGTSGSSGTGGIAGSSGNAGTGGAGNSGNAGNSGSSGNGGSAGDTGGVGNSGNSGSGGLAAGGGDSGSGGSSGDSGGVSGEGATGGAAASSAGGNGSNAVPNESSDGGCGCYLVGAQQKAAWSWGLMGLGALLVLRKQGSRRRVPERAND